MRTLAFHTAITRFHRRILRGLTMFGFHQPVQKPTHSWLGLLVFIASLQALASTQAVAENNPVGLRFVEVSASGEVTASPDYLKLNLRLEHTASNLGKAKKNIDQDFKQLLKVADTLKIKREDIEAAHIENAPQYQWNNGKRHYKGERVVRSIHISLRKLDDYGQLVHQLMQIDSIRVQNTQLKFNNRQALLNQAMVNALELAHTKANLMATTLSATLGKVLSIQEGMANRNPGPMYARARMMSDASIEAEAAPAPMLVQPQTLRSDVTVMFELE